MFQAFGEANAAFSPAELAMAQSLVRDFCSQRQLQVDGADAQDAAREVVSWFRIGVTDKARLRELLASRD